MLWHATNLMDSSRGSLLRWSCLLACAFGVGLVLSAIRAHATEAQTPWECSGYSGDAHTRCLQAYIEMQRDRITKVEGELQAQQGTAAQLKEQVDRQASATADLQRQPAQRPYAVQPGPWVYGYPPVGFSFYFGPPGFYAPPYYFYRPYVYGPRFFYRPRFFRHR